MASLWIGETFEPKNFKKILYVIPSAFLSFLPYYCYSFWIIVIPSILVSFISYSCHSFLIIVIPSVLLSFLPPMYLPYPKGEKIGRQNRPYFLFSALENYTWLKTPSKFLHFSNYVAVGPSLRQRVQVPWGCFQDK